LSLNYVVEDGKVAAATPAVFGANPGEVPSGPSKGLRVLSREEDLARQLYTSLDGPARRKATISEQAPFDVLTEVKAQPKRLAPEGLPPAQMSPRQRETLQDLLHVYADKHPKEVADRLFRDVDLDRVRFGWSGSPQPGQPHYYRVQGPAFVVEYCNTQNRAN